jgi:chromosome segregation ATPase
MPIDRLKFEHEKRQRNISMLRTKVSSMTRDYEQSEEECKRYQAEQRSHGIHHPDLIGENYRNHLIGEMGSCESQISEMESEMKTIEKAARVKHFETPSIEIY